MQDSTSNNAMTEIALALAMGFFSIMVLTMVSMGAGHLGETAAVNDNPTVKFSAPATASSVQNAGMVKEDDTFVIYHNGEFFDRKLNRVDPAGLNAQGRLVLALNPEVSVAEALKAQEKIKAEDMVVTSYDARWAKALKEKGL